MKGLVHSIEPFGTYDGPGIRMVLFLTGCPMSCRFCHNPEIAWSKIGSLYTPDELLAEYQKNQGFYHQGGVTFSGGEPLAQGEFVLACATAMKEEGIHLAVDTSLGCGYSLVDKLLPYIDLWMISIKAISPALHQDLTNRDNAKILQEIYKANATKATMVIRYVIIPGITDTRQELEKLANYILKLPFPPQLELLAYHTMGVAKWQQMGLTYELSYLRDADKDDVLKARVKLIEYGIQKWV